jgi:hypothetical protein
VKAFFVSKRLEFGMRNHHQDPCQQAEGPWHNPRHKFEAIEQSTSSEVSPHLAILSRRPETQTAMVLQANTEVLPKGDEETRRQVVRDVSSRNLQKRVVALLLPSCFGQRSKYSGIDN